MGCIFWILAFVFPPAAACFVCTGRGIAINIILMFLGWFPAIIHVALVYGTASGQRRLQARMRALE